MEREFIVLSVEDNPDDRLILEQAFRRAGRPDMLRSTVDGEELTAYILGVGPYADRARHPLPSVVLLDLRLAGKSGYELLVWLKARPELRHVPVVALSSSRLPSEILRAYELGVTSYFVKPTGFNEMVVMVKELTTYWFVLNRFPASLPAPAAT